MAVTAAGEGGEPADEALMQAFGDGDVAAFEILYRRHKDSLYRYLLRGCGSPALAEELFQDTWQKLVEARSRYQPRAPFGAWLYRLAHNRLVDHYRAQRPSVAVPETLAAPERERPDAQAERRSEAQRLLAALGSLPAEQREIVVLREEQGLTLEEIAEIQGVGRETVKSRLRYALAKLRGALSDD